MIRRARIAPIALLALLMALAALLGMFIALGSKQLTMLAAAGVAGLMLLFVPSQAILTMLLLAAFFGVGLASYYLRFPQGFWMVYALCMFLWLKLPVDALARSGEQAARASRAPLFLATLLAFFVVAVASTALNDTPFINWLVGAKNFVFVWSVAFLVAGGLVTERYLRLVWFGLLLVAALQAPFAVAQHYMAFAGSGNWDAVVGTFGGDPDGSGASGSMAIFLSFAVGAALVFLRERQIPAGAGAAVVVACLIAVTMAEVKVFFVLSPLMVSFVMLRAFARRPVFALAASLAIVVGVTGVASYYAKNYYAPLKSHAAASSGFEEYIDFATGVDTRPDFINRQTGEVSRLGAPLMWWNLASRDGAGKALLGYGMTASRASQTIGLGAAAKHHQFQLTTSTLTVLLWDTGLVGAMLFLATLLLAMAKAWQLSGNGAIPGFHRAGLEASAGALLVGLASSAYNNALVDGPSLQVFYAFVVGYVLYWARRAGQRE